METQMDGATLFFGLVSLVIGAAALELIAYVYIKSTTTRVVRVFMMVMLYFALSALSGAFMLFDPSEESALLLAKIGAFCYIMSSASFLHLAFILARGEETNAFLPTNVFFSLFIVVAFFVGLMMDDVKYVGDGYVFKGTGLTLMMSVISALIIVTFVILAQQYRVTVNSDHRKQYLLMIFAVLSPIVIGVVLITIIAIGDLSIRATHPFESIGVVMFLSYAIYRYHLIIVTPVRERPNVKDFLGPGIKPLMAVEGKSFIVESRKSGTAYALLMEELSKGAEGLIVTREHPDRVREQYGLSKTPMIWLTNALGHENIDPANLSILQRAITDFLRDGNRPVVLLDGLEAMMLNNKPEKVLQAIFNIRDEFIVSRGTLLLSVDPRTIDVMVLAMLEKDLEIVADPWEG